MSQGIFQADAQSETKMTENTIPFTKNFFSTPKQYGLTLYNCTKIQKDE